MAHSSTAWRRCRTAPGDDRLGVPDGREDRQHVGARDLRDRPGADAREGVALKAVPPGPDLLGILPAALLLLDHGGGGLGESGYALKAALVGERVSALTGELAVGDGLLAGLGERDEGDRAEPEFRAPAADDEALDPASRAGRLDVEVEAVAVDVVSGRCGAEEGGGEGVVGMASPALGSGGFGGGLCLCNHHCIICGT